MTKLSEDMEECVTRKTAKNTDGKKCVFKILKKSFSKLRYYPDVYGFIVPSKTRAEAVLEGVERRAVPAVNELVIFLPFFEFIISH